MKRLITNQNEHIGNLFVFYYFCKFNPYLIISIFNPLIKINWKSDTSIVTYFCLEYNGINNKGIIIIQFNTKSKKKICFTKYAENIFF